MRSLSASAGAKALALFSLALLAEILVETGREDIAVLDRHHAALLQERQGGMAGIAEQGGAH
jgi:hypothetical protein